MSGAGWPRDAPAPRPVVQEPGRIASSRRQLQIRLAHGLLQAAVDSGRAQAGRIGLGTHASKQEQIRARLSRGLRARTAWASDRPSMPGMCRSISIRS